jgi:GT2 family glycosyltransferase
VTPAPLDREPLVAVVIVGFRNARDVARCLSALERSTWTRFEVVVAENGGSEAFAALCAATPDRLSGGQVVRRLQAPGNLGFAGGVNFGINASRDADAWWVLNPDTEADPGALSAMVARLRRGGCEAVGSVLYHPDGHVQAYGGHWQLWLARSVSIGKGASVRDAIDAEGVERRQNYLLGASMLVSRRFVELCGLMREDYFLYCEEVEWCRRAGRAGLGLGFAPDARVLHHQGTTTGAGMGLRTQPRLPVYLGERNKILLTRDLEPGRLPVTLVMSLGLIFARYARRGAWRQVGFALAGWWAGLLDRRGPPA